MFRFFFLTVIATNCLAACGYKGDLYLPKEGDKAKYGPVQTGLTIDPIDQKNLPKHD